MDALVGDNSSGDTRDKFRKMLREGQLGEREIEVTIPDRSGAGMPTFDIPGMPGAQMGMINLNEIMGKAFGGAPTKTKKMTVAESYDVLLAEEADNLIDEDGMTDAISAVENDGIVFLDEIDKIAARPNGREPSATYRARACSATFCSD